MTKLRTRLAGALLALALTTPALAQEAGPGRRPPDGQRPPAEAGQRPSGGGLLGLLPPPSTTRHTLALPDRPLDYTATAGTLPLRDGKGETTAEIFSVAYTAEPASPERPVTFVFNGGPGAASAFLHLGGARAAHALRSPRAARFRRRPQARRQSRHLARLHRPGLRRPGRHRLQPRGGDSEDGERRSGASTRTPRPWPRSSASGSPRRPHDLARVPGGRELRRLPRRAPDPRPARGERHRAQRRRPDLARARVRAASTRRSTTPALGALPALDGRREPGAPRREAGPEFDDRLPRPSGSRCPTTRRPRPGPGGLPPGLRTGSSA